MKFYNIHQHSKYSITATGSPDAFGKVPDIVARAVELGYPAIGLTDHSTTAGCIQLYQAARKHGIKPLPGIETYVALNRLVEGRAKPAHLGVLAISEQGWYNLVGLNNLAVKNFKYHTILDYADLAGLSEQGALKGLVATTGCHFGVLSSSLIHGDPESAWNILSALKKWFRDGVYVEAQNHMIDDPMHDEDCHSLLLYGMAKDLDLPMVITQDSHYIYPEQQMIHDEMKRLVSFSDNPDEAVFPGDGYHMVDTEWMRQHHSPLIFQAGMAGLEDLLAKANVVIPELDSFALKVPDVTRAPGLVVDGGPDEYLTMLASTRLQELVASGDWNKAEVKRYSNRVDDELDVVIGAGFSGYLLFVAKVCDWMRESGIRFWTRGSASGSILCWLLGITQVDPIEWGLSFDRFLSRDRSKPPDIDLDVDHTRRKEVVEWLMDHYVAVQMGTWSSLRLDKKDTYKGSLIEKWKMKERRSGRDATRRPSDIEMEMLKDISTMDTFKGLGVHAAGVIVAPDALSMRSLSLAYIASSQTTIAAYEQDEVGALGLLKLDVLGQKTLTALVQMEASSGIKWSDIPLQSDAKVYKNLSAGKTDGVFQMQGWSSSLGIKKMRPTKIKDLIVACALFRPAAMDSGAMDSYLNRRAKVEEIPAMHPLIWEHVKDTYGVFIFQEQSLNLLKALGLTVEQIEKARKAIKASNGGVGGAREVLAQLRADVAPLARAKGMTEADIAWLDHVLDAYAGYSFNLAHATQYGIVAYWTAWYRTHHPAHFWAGMLSAYVGDDDEQEFQGVATKIDKVKILEAHVNISTASTYVVDNGAIRKPLQSIASIGAKSAAELEKHAPYTSLLDLATRTSSVVSGKGDLAKGHAPELCSGVIGALAKAGALHNLPIT